MEVIALDTEMDDPEVLSPRRDQRGLADGLVDATTAQVADRATTRSVTCTG